MNIIRLDNGNLRISLEDSDDLEEMQYQHDKQGHLYWHDLLEPWWANGRYEFFVPADQSPYSSMFVGLTSCCHAIAESIDYPDDGEKDLVGDWWYFNDIYEDPFEVLMTQGWVDFKLAR